MLLCRVMTKPRSTIEPRSCLELWGPPCHIDDSVSAGGVGGVGEEVRMIAGSMDEVQGSGDLQTLGKHPPGFLSHRFA